MEMSELQADSGSYIPTRKQNSKQLKTALYRRNFLWLLWLEQIQYAYVSTAASFLFKRLSEISTLRKDVASVLLQPWPNFKLSSLSNMPGPPYQNNVCRYININTQILESNIQLALAKGAKAKQLSFVGFL